MQWLSKSHVRLTYDDNTTTTMKLSPYGVGGEYTVQCVNTTSILVINEIFILI